MKAMRAVMAVLAGTSGYAAAQQAQRATPLQRPAYQREVPAQLLRRAKVSEDSALRVASARIPSGTPRALELENENGRLIWSFDFAVPNRPGVYEVHVNAITGTLEGRVEHEIPADTAHRDSTRGEERERPSAQRRDSTHRRPARPRP